MKVLKLQDTEFKAIVKLLCENRDREDLQNISNLSYLQTLNLLDTFYKRGLLN